MLTCSSCLFPWLFSVGILAQKAGDGDSLSALWQRGFTQPNINSIIPTSESWSAISNVLLANTPQLGVSLTYVTFNNILTCMVLSGEFSRYKKKRQILRVTDPEGSQRSTFWLSLPYRFSMPLLAFSALLHWAASQTLFLVNITARDPYGAADPDYSVASLGFSSLGLLILVVSLGASIVLTLVTATFFRYPAGVPVVDCNSLAISAACHPLAPRKDESMQRLQYGVMGIDEQGKERIGLSSGPVTPLSAKRGEASNVKGEGAQESQNMLSPSEPPREDLESLHESYS